VLRNLFEKYLNTSIAAYIRKMRVLRACHLLATSSETIGAISDRCGFSSQYAFSRTFKQIAGCSPNAYRWTGRVNH
jgi:two-component system response regulator YesN